jgi:hypothetical protein
MYVLRVCVSSFCLLNFSNERIPTQPSPSIKAQPPTYLVSLSNGAKGAAVSNPSPLRRFQAPRQVSFRHLRSCNGQFQRSVRLQKENQHRQNCQKKDGDRCLVQNLPVHPLASVRTANATGGESCKYNKTIF